MRRKRLIVALALVVAAVLILGGGFLAWRLTHPPVPDRELINRVFDQIERGIETKDPRMILDTVASDYRDSFGFAKRDLHRLSLELLRLRGNPEVTVNNLQITLHGRQADVTLDGVLTAEDEEWSGSLAVHLRKDRRWLITRTSGWQSRAAETLE